MGSQYKQQLDSLMQREISRGQFLQFTGVALLGLIGVTGFIKNLTGIMPAQHSTKKAVARNGYGQSAYGR